MKEAAMLLVGIILALIGTVNAQEHPGKAIVMQVCVACHTETGNSLVPIYPKIAGQIPEYMIKQIKEFKSGVRQNAIMQPMVANLSEEDIRLVADYFSRQTLKPEAEQNAELVTIGKQIYRSGIKTKNLAACMACHGPDGKGVRALYPQVKGQYAQYLVAQLKAFRSEERQNDPERIMRDLAGKMSDREIEAVAQYMSSLR
jgi:cytochrome c553